MPEAPSDLKDPWETPPAALDPELVATSQRLVSKSEAILHETAEPLPECAVPSSEAIRIAELEARNQYLFQRNVALVAKVAALEAANLRLQDELSNLRQLQRLSETPWYLRWLRRSEDP